MVKEDTVKNKKTDDLFSAATDQAIISSDIFRPKESFKSLVLDKSKASNALLTELSSGPTKQVTFVLDKSESKELSASTPEPLDKDEKSKLELQGEQQKQQQGQDQDSDVDSEGYWMSPSLQELKKKSLLELKSIPKFKIGRKHYGELEFLEPVDLTSIVNLDDIAGNLVTFSNKTCVVYPDDNKPKPGEGLNLPARITLEGCYPINKADKLPILDPKSEIVKRHIENLKTIPEMKFISYDPTNGHWTFEVQEMD